uniref:Sulfotransferase domain-containing protein n=1 Tax=Phaeomonas parva TaxID=124430 RepID=A0A6U4GIU2_9STRA|mmetsp:Transcript_29438/g.94536  ORF Transcript_29438/g.94536 Transcript_29438/m.94536 type:complete len:748 (+) Transcript_29438:183-2426(+)
MRHALLLLAVVLVVTPPPPLLPARSTSCAAAAELVLPLAVRADVEALLARDALDLESCNEVFKYDYTRPEEICAAVALFRDGDPAGAARIVNAIVERMERPCRSESPDDVQACAFLAVLVAEGVRIEDEAMVGRAKDWFAFIRARNAQNKRPFSCLEMEQWKESGSSGIFVHVPRTGGTSLRRHLHDAGQATGVDTAMHVTAREMKLCDPVAFADFRVWSVVRSPWDRIVSAFYYLRKIGTSRSWQDTLFQRYLQRYETFEEFVLSGALEETQRWMTHMELMLSYFMDEAGQFLVDELYRFEDVVGSTNFFAAGAKERVNIAVADLTALPKPSLPMKYCHEFSPAVAAEVERVYNADIRALGYAFTCSRAELRSDPPEGRYRNPFSEPRPVGELILAHRHLNDVSMDFRAALRERRGLPYAEAMQGAAVPGDRDGLWYLAYLKENTQHRLVAAEIAATVRMPPVARTRDVTLYSTRHPAGFTSASKAKLQHDRDQLSFLQSTGRLPGLCLSHILDGYDSLLSSITSEQVWAKAISVSTAEAMSFSLNKLLHVPQGGPVPPPPIGATYPSLAPVGWWDIGQQLLEMKNSEARLFENALSAWATEELAAFFREATIWFESTDEVTVSATAEEGLLESPAMLRLVADLEHALAAPLAGMHLTSLRAAKSLEDFDQREPFLWQNMDGGVGASVSLIVPGQSPSGCGGFCSRPVQLTFQWSTHSFVSTDLEFRSFNPAELFPNDNTTLLFFV